MLQRPFTCQQICSLQLWAAASLEDDALEDPGVEVQLPQSSLLHTPHPALGGHRHLVCSCRSHRSPAETGGLCHISGTRELRALSVSATLELTCNYCYLCKSLLRSKLANAIPSTYSDTLTKGAITSYLVTQ